MLRVSRFEKGLAYVAFFLWTILVFLLGIGKLSLDGFGGYAIHFTNWQWTIQGFFFLTDILSLFDKTGFYTFYVVTIGFWLTNGVTWVVFVLIFVVLGENPDLLINMSDRGTGTLSLGLIMDFDRVFHVLPALMIFLYLFLRRDKIAFNSYFFMNNHDNDWGIQLAYAGISMGSTIYFALIYFAITDVNKVYGITLNIGYIMLIGIAVLVIFNLIPFMVFYVKYAKLGKRKAPKDMRVYAKFIQSGSHKNEEKFYKKKNPYDNRFFG